VLFIGFSCILKAAGGPRNNICNIEDNHDGRDEGETLALFNVVMKKFDISMGTYNLEQMDMDASKDCSVNNVMERFESRVQLAMETSKNSIEWQDSIRGTTGEKIGQTMKYRLSWVDSRRTLSI
jgi:hypothetical protein